MNEQKFYTSESWQTTQAKEKGPAPAFLDQ